MVAMAREHFPAIAFEEFVSPPSLPISDVSVNAVLLFSVLTCVPTNAGQRAIVAEAARVLRPGALLYISDLWLQTDERNRERYLRDESKYGTYGVFDLPEGVTVRHHDPRWIADLTKDFETVALDEIDVQTMNGNPAKAFQWFGLKRSVVADALTTEIAQAKDELNSERNTKPTVPVSEEIVDQDRLASLSGLEIPGGGDLVTELIDLFLHEAEVSIEALRTALSANDAAEVKRVVHRLKGCCANMGAVQMAALLENFESADRIHDGPNFLSQIEREFTLASEAFAGYRKLIS
jgi:HPt (histidine-containing phosphotransfer) domain-containing protein